MDKKEKMLLSDAISTCIKQNEEIIKLKKKLSIVRAIAIGTSSCAIVLMIECLLHVL